MQIISLNSKYRIIKWKIAIVNTKYGIVQFAIYSLDF